MTPQFWAVFWGTLALCAAAIIAGFFVSPPANNILFGLGIVGFVIWVGTVLWIADQLFTDH